MEKISQFEQLFNLFVDEARKDRDVQKSVEKYLCTLLHLIDSDPGPLGIASFRGVTFNVAKGAAKDATDRIFAVFRGRLLDATDVVSFANGPSIGFAAFTWLQRHVEDGITWKPDTPKGPGTAKKSLMDVVAGTSEEG